MHPVAYSADYQGDDRSRLSVFFRVFVVIPWLIVGFFYAIAAYVATFIASFAIVFTGNLPVGLYKPMRISSAYTGKALAFYLLLTEDFPPFWMDEDEEAPRFLGSGGDGGGVPKLTLQTTGPAGL